MLFHPTPLNGAFTIDIEKRGDDRGFFARMFCEREFADHGLVSKFVQMNNSYNKKKGVLRGMHYQLPPAAEVKLVRCVQGAIYDFIVDLREGSPTFKQWFGAELSAENRTMMYVPRGFGHGFITLTDDVEAMYLVSDFYAPECERGVRYNDPAIGVTLPVEVTEISDKDAKWPDLDSDFHQFSSLRGI